MFLSGGELAGESGGILAGLAGFLPYLFAFGLGGGQLLGLALGVCCCLPALFLVRLFGCFAPCFAGRQPVAQSVDLGGRALVPSLIPI